MIDIALGDYFAPLQNLANYVSELPTSIQLRESQYVMPWVFVSHVISMCMFAGTILMMDLRLLGVGYMQTPFSQVQRRLFPWQMVAMFVSSATGLALVWGNPLNYEYPSTKGQTTVDKPAIWSVGPDGKDDNGSNDDINNWVIETP